MLVVHPSTIKAMQQAFADAVHQLTDENGRRAPISTIDEKTMRAAALSALLQLTGEVVWPADRDIPLPQPKQPAGAISFR